ncbi:MAG: hypothetical protein A4E41_00314 [Methanoregulaceae archaeon PtaU1.Bin066]|nr:MAG: hypothetical protein A4E41_00314 [Methanoregulaceae archaeon PtaU1.Bin066]
MQKQATTGILNLFAFLMAYSRARFPTVRCEDCIQ